MKTSVFFTLRAIPTICLNSTKNRSVEISIQSSDAEKDWMYCISAEVTIGPPSDAFGMDMHEHVIEAL